MQKKSDINNVEELNKETVEETGEETAKNPEDADNQVETPAADGPSSNQEQPGAEAEITVLQEQLKKLQEENAEVKNNLLRKHADFENFRKRMNKEKEDSIRYANQMLLLDITDTIDNFERAMKSAEESKDFDAFHSGVVLIEKQLVSMLENKWGLKRFVSEGEPFDPDRHQAIAVEESGEVENEMVIEDFQKGYLYYDRVLRPAKVKVCKPAAGDLSETNNE